MVSNFSTDKRTKGYICQQCNVNLSSSQSFCHVHHINGVNFDNEDDNLQVLCVDCHRKEHNGYMYVSRQSMLAIAKLRYEQGIGSNVTWDEAIRLVDPALRGDLEKAKHSYVEPYIHYKVIDKTTGTAHFLDVAWPNSGFALNMETEGIDTDFDLYGPLSFVNE